MSQCGGATAGDGLSSWTRATRSPSPRLHKIFGSGQQKTPYPFGYGAATGGPPVLTSSTSSYHRGPERQPGPHLLRLTLRQKGLKDSLDLSGTGRNARKRAQN